MEKAKSNWLWNKSITIMDLFGKAEEVFEDDLLLFEGNHGESALRRWGPCVNMPLSVGREKGAMTVIRRAFCRGFALNH